MIVVYVTFPDLETAKALSESVLKARLAACANVFSPHTSLYWWDGEIQSAQEVAVLYKTRADFFENLQSALKAGHPYECPCIVSWPLEQGNPQFLQWIAGETQIKVL